MTNNETQATIALPQTRMLLRGSANRVEIHSRRSRQYAAAVRRRIVDMERTGTYVMPELDDARFTAPTGYHEPDAPRGTNADLHYRPRILLLDDDTHMLEVGERMLRSMGYLFTTKATSGKEALLQLEHDPHSAELILCDLSMPDMDGIEFLQTLNASNFRGSVILFSGESARLMHSVQRLLGGRQLTILGALTKPASRDAFRKLLECWRPQPEILPKRKAYAVHAAELGAATTQRQWVVHYQPQVALRTGALIGMEALVRWDHPQHGLLYPDQFIALAEDCGAIDAITYRVVRSALEQGAQWRAQGLNVRLSINLSMQSLRAADFARTLITHVREFGAAPQDVTLEITETHIGSSSGIPLENLIRLRLARFTLAIDDFGTGHSSLAQLRDVPFTELKVDRGFVRGARHNQIIRPILEGSLGIAKRMGMQSVAEGIESVEDWELLRQLDCDVGQGYFIGRPMESEQVMGWLSEWQGRLPLLLR